MSIPSSGGTLANTDLGLLETGNFADGVIICGDRTWNVHKALLSSRCKWFERAFFGGMAEAASGKIVLEEQDPELIGVMLRYLYSRDFNMANLTKNKGVPVLSIKLFRTADFFLIEELRKHAIAGLRSHLDLLLAKPDTKTPGNAPIEMVEVTEVFDGVKEAYKTDSAVYLRDMLLYFLWMRSGKIFQLPQMKLLLGEIPGLADDLMLKYIAGGGTTYLHDVSQPPKGLLLVEAISSSASNILIYKPGDRKANVKGVSDTRCILRVTPGRPSPFKAVNATTGALIKELAWVTPATSHIDTIISHESLEIICLTRRLKSRPAPIWLCFETAGDAKYYTGCHSGVDRNVRHMKIAKSDLRSHMQDHYKSAPEPQS